MSKLINIIFWVVLGILIGLFLTGYLLNKVSNNMCKEECEDINALAHNIISSGNWKLNDVCVCYGNDWVKSWRMGKANHEIKKEVKQNENI